jgi:hypothetical protein
MLDNTINGVNGEETLYGFYPMIMEKDTPNKNSDIPPITSLQPFIPDLPYKLSFEPEEWGFYP